MRLAHRPRLVGCTAHMATNDGVVKLDQIVAHEAAQQITLRVHADAKQS